MKEVDTARIKNKISKIMEYAKYSFFLSFQVYVENLVFLSAVITVQPDSTRIIFSKTDCLKHHFFISLK